MLTAPASTLDNNVGPTAGFAAGSSHHNAQRRPLNILVVEDDDGDRAQLKRVLKQTGLPHTCAETSSIDNALEACEKCAFDCAIVDYQLPGQDGVAGSSHINSRL